MLCLALGNYDRAVIVDPARPASFDIALSAFATLFPAGEQPSPPASCCNNSRPCAPRSAR